MKHDCDVLYQRACDIAAGLLDDEMPDYTEITAWLSRVPVTWIPGLLRRLVVIAVMRGVFSDGGLEHTVAAARAVGENPGGSILREPDNA